MKTVYLTWFAASILPRQKQKHAQARVTKVRTNFIFSSTIFTRRMQVKTECMAADIFVLMSIIASKILNVFLANKDRYLLFQ